MRVCIRRKNDVLTVIEVIQFIRFDAGTIGMIMPYSKYLETRNYECYESLEEVDESDFNYWCEQLTRNGYLDLSRTKLHFRTGIAKK